MKPNALIFFFFFDEKKNYKKAKITKRAYTFKNYAYSYNVEIMIFFNSEQHLTIPNSQLKIN